MLTTSELRIEQVLKGTLYKGYVKIGEATIEYETTFTTSIPEFVSMETPKKVSEIRELVQFKVKRDDTEIELTDDEYKIFLLVIGALAIKFYYCRLSCECWEMMRGQSEFGRVVSVSIGVTVLRDLDIPPNICEILNSPKFGCALPTTK